MLGDIREGAEVMDECTKWTGSDDVSLPYQLERVKEAAAALEKAPGKKVLSNSEVGALAASLAIKIGLGYPNAKRLYGVPRGGVPAAYAVSAASSDKLVVVDTPDKAEVIIDDLIDSGRTRDKWTKAFPDKPFLALVDKSKHFTGNWLVFPWEGGTESSIEDAIVRLLQFIGEDPARGGLIETPTRVAKAWEFWTSGYNVNPADVLKTFTDGATGYDEMVLVKDIPFYSHCEHHLAPFFGTVTIGYVPEGKIVGLSKLSRLVEVFARRLQVQEHMTVQIADALVDALSPKGVGVLVSARHLCMESRGISKQGHHTTTSALRGVLMENGARAEFLGLSR